ncbi:MAG: phosphatase PAP2 family protein [Acidimicrobiales bacterium]
MQTSFARSESGIVVIPTADGAVRETDRAIGQEHPVKAVAIELALVVAAALAYFGVRGLTEGSEPIAVANARRVLRLEAFFEIDIEESLQGFVLGHRSLVTAANWVYIWGHWPVILVTLLWLYRRHNDTYKLLRNAIFISGAVGLVIFVAFPVAPPRLMPTGFVDTVTELSTSYRILQPPALVNKFAAVPSLHVGWNLLVGIIVYQCSRKLVPKVFAVSGPALMATAVVLTANHYILDAVAGSLVAITGLLGALAVRHIFNIDRTNTWAAQAV